MELLPSAKTKALADALGNVRRYPREWSVSGGLRWRRWGLALILDCDGRHAFVSLYIGPFAMQVLTRPPHATRTENEGAQDANRSPDNIALSPDFIHGLRELRKRSP